MTTTFRKTLLSTTMLAGLAIFALDAAQAGPNGGPSLGSISGFSSMRMDFNRIGGPSRALSRDDTRVIPLDTVKKTEKSKDTKNTAKKGTDLARVSNPKSAGGGKGKEVVSAPALRIPAPLAELYRVTGGNLDDISQLAELASWLKTGLPAAGSPLFDKGDGSFVPPTLGASDRLPWGDAENGSGNNTPQPFGNPNGKVSNGGDISIERYPDGSRRETVVHPNGRDFTVTDYGPTRLGDNGTVVREERRTTVTNGRATREPWRKVAYDIDDPAINGGIKDGPTNYAEPAHLDPDAPRNSTGGDNEDEITESSSEETSGGENPPDSQPTEEGTGRSRGMHTVRCDIAGCLDLGMTDGRRVNPGHGNPDGSGGVDASGGGLPSWATDPCPDCGGRVSGGGFHRPGGSDIGWRGPGGGGEGGGNPPVPAPR